MKGFKKLTAALIAAAMTTAVMAIPAMAEKVTDVSYSASAYGWSEFTFDYYDGGAYVYYEKGDDYFYVSQYDDNLSNVRSLDTAEYFNPQFITINGNEFLKDTYTSRSQDRGEWTYCVDYIYIDGKGNEYDFSYYSYNSSMPYLQDFENVVKSATFTYPAQTGVTTGPVGNDVISIYVNGSQVFPDADPVIINDRTLVPIRVIAEKLGYGVDWDGATCTVTMTKGNMAVQVQINSTWITKYINGQVSEYGQMDVSAQIINDRTFIPVRAVTEALGATVDWDGNTRSVFIDQQIRR